MRRSRKAHILLVRAAQKLQLAAAEASFTHARPYKTGKATFREDPSTQVLIVIYEVYEN
jgi:hypothetical protein